MRNIIKFLCFLFVSIALMGGVLLYHEYIIDLFSKKQWGLFGTFEQPSTSDRLLILPAEMTLTNFHGKSIEVLLLNKDKDYVQFERLEDNEIFKYPLADLDLETQALVRRYEDRVLVTEYEVAQNKLDLKKQKELSDEVERIEKKITSMKVYIARGGGLTPRRILEDKIAELQVKRRNLLFELKTLE